MQSAFITPKSGNYKMNYELGYPSGGNMMMFAMKRSPLTLILSLGSHYHQHL